MTMGALTGLIPIAVAGGMALKFTQAAMPTPQKAKRKARRSTTKKQAVRKVPSPSFGNFSNINL